MKVVGKCSYNDGHRAVEWSSKVTEIMIRTGWTRVEKYINCLAWKKEGRNEARLYCGDRTTGSTMFRFLISNGMGWGEVPGYVLGELPDSWWPEMEAEALETEDYFSKDGSRLNRGPDKGGRPKLTITLELLE
jgi:hypothetical protein